MWPLRAAIVETRDCVVEMIKSHPEEVEALVLAGDEVWLPGL